ncbi:hypothetical protein VB713_20490 [Anabaena cylindrica UHCC 0172]|uniref:hypothetical protein n=1 Tax=Anabaena cylindrica TaxID=1165 RepID=UPI002B221446|nr:hypothetical protein [Anabaena cylindrica]MEA5553321.1 hypothetical protein [Anabaena cylindrica UHCC 0172]
MAQPTKTAAPVGTAEAATVQPPGTADREPEKPKDENLEKTEATTAPPERLHTV